MRRLALASVIASVTIALWICAAPTASFALGITGSAPFTVSNGALLIRAKIDGHGPYPVLLDTSAPRTSIDISLARSLSLALGGSPTGSPAGAPKVESYTTTVPSITLAGRTVRSVDAVAVDLSPQSKAVGAKIDAVLNVDVLRGRVVEIDFPNHKLTVYDRSAVPYTPPASSSTTAVLPFGYYDGLVTNGIKAGEQPLVASIDTCLPAAFTLTQAAASALSLATSTAAGSVQSVQTGYTSLGEASSVAVKNVTVGTIPVATESVPVFPAGSPENEASWSIAIGNGFLSRCDLVIDDRDEILVIRRR